MANPQSDNWARRLPTKLSFEPLVDAVFELRFTSSVSVASILPGVLFSALQTKHKEVTVGHLPGAEIPTQIRQLTPDFKYVPQIGIELDGFRIAIGESSIAISCKLPYRGGTQFKEFIVEVVERLAELNIVSSIERYSMKYTDIIPPLDPQDQSKTFELNLSLAGTKLNNQHASVRMEIIHEGAINIIQIITLAQVSMLDGNIRSGGLIDIDTVINHATPDVAKFVAELPQRIHNVRMTNKKVFFNCLTEAAINSLGPTYE